MAERRGPEGTYTEVWECEPPPVGVAYRVLDQEWSDDYHVRTIRRVLTTGTPWEQPHPFASGGVDIDGPEPWCCKTCGMSGEHNCHNTDG